MIQLFYISYHTMCILKVRDSARYPRMIVREMTQSTRRFTHRQRCLVLFLRVLSPFTTFVGLVDDFTIARESRYNAGTGSEVLLPLRKPQ